MAGVGAPETFSESRQRERRWRPKSKHESWFASKLMLTVSGHTSAQCSMVAQRQSEVIETFVMWLPKALTFEERLRPARGCC